MEYTKIISVSGLPGLFELVASKNDGAIVRALDDKSTRFVSSRVHHFSHLESIEVFTVRENVNLVEIFNAMEASNEKIPDDKDNGKLRKYFEKVYPDMDFDRVYASDMKKMIKWYQVLNENKIEIKLSEPVEEEMEAEPVAVEEKPAAAAPKKSKPAAEKAAPAKPKKAAKKTATKTATKTAKKSAKKK